MLEQVLLDDEHVDVDGDISSSVKDQNMLLLLLEEEEEGRR